MFFAPFRQRDKGARGEHPGVLPRKNTWMFTPDNQSPRGISRGMQYLVILITLKLTLP